MISKKKIVISTWCTDDYREYIGINELTKSIKYFHPEIDHHIANQIWTAESGNWNAAKNCLDLSKDYDMVIHIDGDAVVLGI